MSVFDGKFVWLGGFILYRGILWRRIRFEVLNVYWRYDEMVE